MIVFVNGQCRDIAERAALTEVLDPDTANRRGVAVAVDGVVVPRSRHADIRLAEGARVEVVTAVQGG